MRRWQAGLALALFGQLYVAMAQIAPAMADDAISTSTNWSGVQVGLQGGKAWTDTGWTFPVDSYFTLPAGLRSFDTDPDGGFIGGHLTWYRQVGSIVFGADLAVNRSSISETRVGTFTPLFPTDEFRTSIDYFGTLSGRLGFARGNNLVYASGGYAHGMAHYRAVSGPPGAGVIGDVKRYRGGWTVGGGLEHHITESVVLGLGYDYIRLEGDTTSIETTGTPSSDPFVLQTDDVEIHAVSARVSIKLDALRSTP